MNCKDTNFFLHITIFFVDILSLTVINTTVISSKKKAKYY